MKRKRVTITIFISVILLLLFIFVDYFYYNNSGSSSSEIVSLEIKQCSREIPVSPENYDRNCIYLREFHQEILPSDFVYTNSCLFIEIENQSRVIPLNYITEENILILEKEMPQIGIYNFDKPEYFFKLQIIFSTENIAALNNISTQSVLNGKIWITNDDSNDFCHYELDKTNIHSMHRSEIYYFGMELHFDIKENMSVTNHSHLLQIFKVLY